MFRKRTDPLGLFFVVLLLITLVLILAGCSGFQGQVGKAIHEFEDEKGRHCTAMKWGDSASIDCDYPGGAR